MTDFTTTNEENEKALFDFASLKENKNRLVTVLELKKVAPELTIKKIHNVLLNSDIDLYRNATKIKIPNTEEFYRTYDYYFIDFKVLL